MQNRYTMVHLIYVTHEFITSNTHMLQHPVIYFHFVKLFFKKRVFIDTYM